MRFLGHLVVFTFAAFVLASPAHAESLAKEVDALKKRLAELEAKLAEQEQETEVLKEEVADDQLARILPEKGELKSQYGFGPAASGVYGVKQGLSIGGYGEANYRNFVSDQGSNKDQTDFLRFVTYLGYKFNDSIVFNSEIEYEHASTDDIGGESGDKDGSVSVEFAYLDFFIDEAINARAGMLLTPIGFVNEMHEPATFHGVLRPEVETRIIPSTSRENGIGIFGNLGEDIEYRSYIMNGLRASRFGDTGIRGGRQKGNRALAEDLAWVTRVDYTPSGIPGLLLGGSFYLGDSGQDEIEGADVRTILGEAHAQYHRGGLELRALGAWIDLDDADILSEANGETIGDEQNGFYGEIAYNILPLFNSDTSQYVAPFFRYEQYDTHASVPTGFTEDESLDKEVFVFGISYRPLPHLAIKADYRNFETDGESKTADEFALGMGFAF